MYVSHECWEYTEFVLCVISCKAVCFMLLPEVAETRYIGCWTEDALTNRVWKDNATTTINSCIDKCREEEYKYAAIDVSTMKYVTMVNWNVHKGLTFFKYSRFSSAYFAYVAIHKLHKTTQIY